MSAVLADAAAAVESGGKSLVGGVQWLLAHVADDGGWHSETYGALRQGAATTALAIYALAHTPPKSVSSDLAAKAKSAAAKGLDFLRPGLRKKGFVAAPDGSLDYPTYGTALIVTAAGKLDFGLTKDERARFSAWVMSGQLHETREFTLKSPHYGGWDLMGASQVIGLTSDTTVSCSCYALEAIADAAGENAKRTRERALGWAKRCQDLSGGGGFWFSPDPMSINHKAGFKNAQQTEPKTYASATADGLRCLLYAGAKPEDDSVAAAVKYLSERPELKHVPGFDDSEDPNGWALGLRYYYYQSLAKVLPYFAENDRAKRRSALLAAIAAAQHKDGRWQNECSRMREDDPLIATCLMLTALGVLLG